MCVGIHRISNTNNSIVTESTQNTQNIYFAHSKYNDFNYTGAPKLFDEYNKVNKK